MNNFTEGDRVRVTGTTVTGTVEKVSLFATGCRAGTVRYVKVVEDDSGNVRLVAPGANGRVDILEHIEANA